MEKIIKHQAAHDKFTALPGLTLRTYTYVTRKSQELAKATMGNILTGAL